MTIIVLLYVKQFTHTYTFIYMYINIYIFVFSLAGVDLLVFIVLQVVAVYEKFLEIYQGYLSKIFKSFKKNRIKF